MEGNSGLLDGKDRDLFSEEYPEKKLGYLKLKLPSSQGIYNGILRSIFHTSGAAPLHCVDLKKAGGEIALKAGTAEFFGVINIGDDAQFLKLLKQKEPNIPIEKDNLSTSVFGKIKEDNSKINFLVGAKKFIEGWDCWRVSNMGLLNIGKREGSQIIQLFGRGVRLKGRDFSLKRSSALHGIPPEHIQILETLNIFGIKANYMDLFQEHLENEGIDTDVYIEKQLKIKIDENFLNKGLQIPFVDSSKYRQEELFKLIIEEDTNIVAQVDLMPKVEVITSLEKTGIQSTTDNPSRKINEKYIDLMNWDNIYFALMDYRNNKRWNNIVFDKATLKQIIKNGLYDLKCPFELINPSKFKDIWRLEEVTISILKKYIARYYLNKKDNWNKRNMEIKNLEKNDGNFEFDKYSLKVLDDEVVRNTVEESLEEDVYGTYLSQYITNVYFDRHLYQPLLAQPKDVSVRISPTGLNSGELKFIKDLKDFCNNYKELFIDNQLYILRNLPRKGVGFFETAYFYPDFIIWVKMRDKQHIIFADPKGLGYSWALNFKSEKLDLSTKIKDFENNLNTKYPHNNIILHSFIISVTKYLDVNNNIRASKANFNARNVLFQNDDKDYIKQMFQRIYPQLNEN